jgi:hypothetical protein
LIDLIDRRVDGVDLLQMQLQQEAVVPGHATAQGCGPVWSLVKALSAAPILPRHSGEPNRF